MVYWKEVYKEIGQRIIDKLLDDNDQPIIKHIDLWHEQVNYLTEELPFDCPAVFVEFNVIEANDTGAMVQHLTTQIDLHLFYETFSDTYMGAIMQDNALDYLDVLTKLNAIFHGKPGTSFSAMRKTDMKREDSGGAGNLYRITFECEIHDYSAERLFNEETMTNQDIIIEKGIPDVAPPEMPFPEYSPET